MKRSSWLWSAALIAAATAVGRAEDPAADLGSPAISGSGIVWKAVAGREAVGERPMLTIGRPVPVPATEGGAREVVFRGKSADLVPVQDARTETAPRLGAPPASPLGPPPSSTFSRPGGGNPFAPRRPSGTAPLEPAPGTVAGPAGPAIAAAPPTRSSPPKMMGDFPGTFVTGTVTVRSLLTDTIPNFALVTDTFTVTTPVLSRGAFKVSENESPRPDDRVYINYNFFNTFGARVLGGDGSLTLLPAAANFPAFGAGPFPLRDTLGNTLTRNPNVATRTLTNVTVGDYHVHRETFGLEKTLYDGNASIGVRVPLIHTGQSISANLDGGLLGGFQGVPTTGRIANVGDSFDTATIGDISVLLKYAFVNDKQTGDVLSGGIVVTAPTGGGVRLPGGGRVNATLLQPYVGYILNFDRFYVHGFSALAISTDSRDTLVAFNDIGVGYYAYRGAPGSILTSVVPTIEGHLSTGLNGGGRAIGLPDLFALTGGVHFGLGERTMLTVGGSLPLTGPRPYNFEVVAQLEVKF